MAGNPRVSVLFFMQMNALHSSVRAHFVSFMCFPYSASPRGQIEGNYLLLSKYMDSPLHPERFSKKRSQWGHCFFLASVLDTITSLF